MTSMDNPPGGGNEEDLEDGEIFDDEEQSSEVLPTQKPLMPPSFVEVDSNGPKSLLSPDSFSPERQRNNVNKERKSFDVRIERRIERGGRSAPPPRRHIKRGRDSEEEAGKPSKPKLRRASDGKKSGSAGEDEVDENEMIYVMGGNSPTSNKNPEWENRFSDEEVEQPSNRGRRGAGPRRAFEGARTIRRSRFTRGGKARNTRKPDHRNEFTLCKFYMAGNCQRGKDCPFSHDASPPKRMELCKFYMNDCCNKKEKCLYMHQEFPCKFFHSGLKCYAGKRCKYSHGKINNYLRQALNKHLEQCDLRDEHERMKEMFERKERGFERYNRFSDRDERRRSTSLEREEEGHTPMPSPQQNHFSDREGGSLSPGDRPDRLRHEDRREDGFRNDNFRNDQSLRARDNRRNNRCRKRRHDFDGRNDEDGFYKDFPHQSMDQQNMDFVGDDMHDKNQGNFYNDDESKSQDNSENLPANMPRTQRELYMRIQQQMKKSESKTREDMGKEDDFREENWYSSDEESGGTSGGPVNNPLKIIFSNVPGLQNPNDQSSQDESHKPNPQLFPDIDVNAVTKLLSSIRESVQKKKDEEKEQKKIEEESVGTLEITHPQSSTSSNSPDEKRGLRDPRLRGAPNPMVLTAADLDLRSSPPRPITESPSSSPLDVDLRSLPFKPAPVHEAATEINASISSGPPIEWALKVLPPIGPDYKLMTGRLSAQFCLNDPRLKTHIQPQVLAQTQQAIIGSGGLISVPPMGGPIGMSSPPLIPPGILPMTSLIPGGSLLPSLPPMMCPGGAVPSGGPVGIRDPRQRHGSGDTKPPLINDPRRKGKGPEIEDNDLRNLAQMPLQFRTISDTDLRLSAHPQAFFK